MRFATPPWHRPSWAAWRRAAARLNSAASRTGRVRQVGFGLLGVVAASLACAQATATRPTALVRFDGLTIRELQTSPDGACAEQSRASSEGPDAFRVPASPRTSLSGPYLFPPGAHGLQFLRGEFNAQPGAEYVVRIHQVSFTRTFTIHRVADGSLAEAIAWIAVPSHECPR